jgi:hypothetical protein
MEDDTIEKQDKKTKKNVARNSTIEERNQSITVSGDGGRI